MGDFDKQVKDRAKDLKLLFKKGAKIVGVCKKGWYKIKHIRK